jgi:hypothetical protein
MIRFLTRYVDDLLLWAGCVCVLYGLSLWSLIITWIVAGLMLIGLGVLIGKVKGRHAPQ